MPCSGAIYTSVLASSLLQTGGYRYGVVAGAEKMHRLWWTYGILEHGSFW